MSENKDQKIPANGNTETEESVDKSKKLMIAILGVLVICVIVSGVLFVTTKINTRQEIEKQANQIDTLQGTVSDNDLQINELTEEMSNAEAQISEFEEIILDKNIKIEELETELVDKGAQITNLLEKKQFGEFSRDSVAQFPVEDVREIAVDIFISASNQDLIDIIPGRVEIKNGHDLKMYYSVTNSSDYVLTVYMSYYLYGEDGTFLGVLSDKYNEVYQGEYYIFDDIDENSFVGKPYLIEVSVEVERSNYEFCKLSFLDNVPPFTTMSNNKTTLTGTIVNNEEFECDGADIALLYYKDNGLLVDADTITIWENVAPGSTIEFDEYDYRDYENLAELKIVLNGYNY